MSTNVDRLGILKERVTTFNEELVRKGLEDQYLALVKEIADGQQAVKPISDEEWETMLPKEREANLLLYYHTLRSELQSLSDEVKRQGAKGKLAEWLQQPWVRVTASAASLIQFAVTVITLAHGAGLFAMEDDDDSLA